ncbi:MAG: class I SAM-dependent methyltransferase [Candidatus Eisenbacteria bacterium]|uniref:Class I SAM-dependent methyltransferase n=1 Tax=Eiseniibacteriota bacterium TaxID=2212470 RepID=A0A938BQZ2_UNCEI|nr:class I SAM-dependent methyltransferase [Candidatus Eisenbacteria bacterium]
MRVAPPPGETTLARRADRHALYESAVQNPPADVGFMQRTFRQHRGRPPRILREDFCGTAAMCAAWVKAHQRNRAWGIDLDERTLNWGIRRHLLPLGPPAARVTLIRQDVLAPVDFKSDVIAAFNFSYFAFKDRDTLRRYFSAARAALVRDGILYLDLFGGPESMDLREEQTELEGFTYVWDQAALNPITHEITCHIHFDFPDGSRLAHAFSYRWRLWQIPEVEDLLREAGFRRSMVYWEGTERKTGEGNGVYRPSRKGDNAPAFVCYLLGLK